MGRKHKRYTTSDSEIEIDPDISSKSSSKRRLAKKGGHQTITNTKLQSVIRAFKKEPKENPENIYQNPILNQVQHLMNPMKRSDSAKM